MDVWEHVCVWVWLLQSRVTVCIVVLYPHVYRLSSPQQLQDSAELIIEAKSNMHRQRLLQPIQDYQINELPSQSGSGGSGSTTAAGGAAATSITPGGDKEQASSKHLSHDEQSKPPRGGLKKVSSVRTHTYIHTDTDKHTLEKMKRRSTHIFFVRMHPSCLASPRTQTYSIKDRRSEATRLSKMRLMRDPPLITTTAATPQDSPSTTMEPGMSFRQWGDLEVS